MGKKSREAAAERAAQQANVASQQSELSMEAKSEPSGDSDGLQKTEMVRPAMRNEPRRLAEEEIEAREERESRRERDAEKRAVSQEPQAAPEPEPASEPEPQSTTESEQPNSQVESEPEQPVIPTAKVKVDGQEFDVPQAEIDAAGGLVAYQKEKAADSRLEKTNRVLAETRQTQAAIAQFLQNQQATLTPAKPVETDAQFIASKMDVVRFGTAEESAVALQEILNRQRVDQNAITQNAVTAIQKIIAVDNFKKEFQDVVSNPLLLRLAVTLENERTAKGGRVEDWATFYRTIGNEVRSITGQSARQNQPTDAAKGITGGNTSQSPSDREARKASIVNLPTAAARAALPENKPETREDILNDMRKSRGIPVG